MDWKKLYPLVFTVEHISVKMVQITDVLVELPASRDIKTETSNTMVQVDVYCVAYKERQTEKIQLEGTSAVSLKERQRFWFVWK